MFRIIKHWKTSNLKFVMLCSALCIYSCSNSSGGKHIGLKSLEISLKTELTEMDKRDIYYDELSETYIVHNPIDINYYNIIHYITEDNEMENEVIGCRLYITLPDNFEKESVKPLIKELQKDIYHQTVSEINVEQKLTGKYLIITW